MYYLLLRKGYIIFLSSKYMCMKTTGRGSNSKIGSYAKCPWSVFSRCMYWEFRINEYILSPCQRNSWQLRKIKRTEQWVCYKVWVIVQAISLLLSKLYLRCLHTRKLQWIWKLCHVLRHWKIKEGKQGTCSSWQETRNLQIQTNMRICKAPANMRSL
jgi:hypothetical protein